MIAIQEDWYMMISAGTVLFIALCIFIGYKAGFIRRTVSLIGTVVSFYGAWFLSDTLSHYIGILPANLLEGTGMAYEAVYQFLNQVCWFGALFLFFKILFFLLDLIIKSVQKMPVIKTFSAALGGILGFLESVIWILVICAVLTTPIFVGGTKAVENTLLGQIRTLTVSVLEEYLEPVVESDAFGQMMTDVQDLSNDQKKALEFWLEEHGYDKEEVLN